MHLVQQQKPNFNLSDNSGCQKLQFDHMVGEVHLSAAYAGSIEMGWDEVALAVNQAGLVFPTCWSELPVPGFFMTWQNILCSERLFTTAEDAYSRIARTVTSFF